MRRRGLRAALYAGPPVLWMALIFYMSTGAGSTEGSTLLVTGLLRWLSPRFLASLSPAALDGLDFALRKSAHVVEYFVLALLCLRALQAGRPAFRPASALGAAVLCALYAASDELHQLATPGRTASLSDVGIDAVAAMGAILLAAAWFGVKGVERRVLALPAEPALPPLPASPVGAPTARD
jgi:VanZ family protein